MRTSLKILTIATALVVGIAAAPALYAQSTGTVPSPMAGKNKMPMSQMGEGNMSMGQQGQMGQMGQGNMMAMMKQMMQKHTEMMKTMMEDHAGEKSKKTQ